MGYLVTILSMVLSFFAGLLSFKIKSRWCRECGLAVGTLCVECRNRHRVDNLRASGQQRPDTVAGAA